MQNTTTVCYSNIYAYVGGNPVSFVDPTGTEAAGLLVGAGVGAVYGGLGAYLSGGGWQEVFYAASTGALVGGALGALDPTLGIGTTALIAGGASAIGDIFAQTAGGKCFNAASTAGAALGGAIGGIGGGILGRYAAVMGTGRLISANGFSLAANALTSGGGTLLGAAGSALGDAAGGGDCGCKP